MRLLLDTHTLIWWWKDDPILSSDIRAVLDAGDSTVFVSAASAWELATKVRKGRLLELKDRLPGFRSHVEDDGFHLLEIRAEHGVHGGLLEGTHKDPFDRLLAAQALMEGMTVVTCDRQIATFGCEVLW
jgi:PIN domain nuclease of toxin-antitoxin system